MPVHAALISDIGKGQPCGQFTPGMRLLGKSADDQRRRNCHSLVDIDRVENGKIAAHWVVGQDEVLETASGNPMFEPIK